MQYPDWIMEAKKSRKLLSWIKDPEHSIQQFGSQLLFKSKQENCMLFYAVPSVEAPGKELRQLNFCGVLHLPDYIYCMKQALPFIRRLGYRKILFFQQKRA